MAGGEAELETADAIENDGGVFTARGHGHLAFYVLEKFALRQLSADNFYLIV